MERPKLYALATLGLTLLVSLGVFALVDARGGSRLWGTLGALLAGLTLGYFTLVGRARAIAELSTAIQAMVPTATSASPPRLIWRRRDELRTLAGDFNAMAERISARQAELSEEVLRLRAVLEGMVEGVLVLGSDGRIALANPSLRQLLDSWDELEGKLPLEAFRNVEIDAVLQDARESGKPLAREVRLSRDGSRIAEVHAVSLEGGASQTVVAVFEDRTELRRLEEMRRDFVANASHELKTPITAIRGFAEILGRPGISDEDRAKQLVIIQQNADRLSLLVDDLLELSRIESGRSRHQPTQLDLCNLAGQVIEDLRPMLSARQISAEMACEGQVHAHADAFATQQILRNLIDNAAKYTDPGGHVVVRLWRDSAGAQFAVQDDGIGIKPADQARIFERFYRVDETRSRALGGTGLGLAIVKHLAQSAGGEIHVTSVHGEGSTFTVTLPTEPVEAKASD